MKKILTIIMFVSAALLSCTTEPMPVSEAFVTNYVELVITNTPDHVVSVDLMNAVRGEWLVSFETLTGYSNGYDAGSNIINLPFVQTNTYDSVTNGGYDGAFSYVFNADFSVDKNVYNSQGNLLAAYTNAFRYSILSNEYGLRIEMTISGENQEVQYVEPMGPFAYLDDPVTNIITKTNLSQFGDVISVFNDTNELYIVVVQTNGWRLLIEKTDTIDSFIMDYGIIGASTNMTWSPDTDFMTLLNNFANTLSQRQETHDISVWIEGDNGSDNSAVFFQLNDSESYRLKKIK